MQMDRTGELSAWGAMSIALILLMHPILPQQPPGANSNDSKASVAGKITAASGEGAVNVIPGVTVKLTGPSLGPAGPQ